LCSHQRQFHELRPCFQKQNFIFNHCKPPNSPYAQEQCTATHTMHRLEHWTLECHASWTWYKFEVEIFNLELKKFKQTIYNTKLSLNARKNNENMSVMKNNLNWLWPWIIQLSWRCPWCTQVFCLQPMTHQIPKTSHPNIKKFDRFWTKEP
jgi:hypothetical protein